MDAVKVPLTDKLLPVLFEFQQTVSNQVASPSVKKMGELVVSSQQLIQNIIGKGS